MSVEYALRAITCMASQIGQPTLADDIAKAVDVPGSYLNRVLQDLVAAGLVRSRCGPGGGDELALAPGKITMLHVVCGRIQ